MHPGSNNLFAQHSAPQETLWDGSAHSLPAVLLEDIPYFIWVKDIEGRYIFVNDAYRRFFSVRKDQRLGLTDVEVHPAPLAATYRNEDLQVIKTRLPLQLEERYQDSPSDPTYIYETVKRPLFSASGEVTGVYATSQNVTEKRAFDEKISRQKRLLEALHAMSFELIKQKDIDELLQLTLERSAAAVGATIGFIEIVDDNKSCMKIRHFFGENISLPANYKLHRGQALAGQIWNLGKVIALDDYQNWPDRLTHSGFSTIHAMVGVPIFSGPEVTGVITLCHSDPDLRFDETDVAALEQFGALASVALENARLFEAAGMELQQRRDSEQLYRALVEQASDVILLFDPTTRRLLQANNRYLDLTGYSETDIPQLSVYDVVVDEHRWIDQYFDVIIPQARSIAPETRRFRRKDGSIFDLERSASLVTIGGRDVIMSVGRDISERRHTRLMEFLHETTLDIVGHLNQQELLAAIVKRAVKLVDADVGYCALLREGSPKMDVMGVVGASPDIFLNGPRTDAGLAPQVIQSGNAVVLDDYKNWPGRLPNPDFSDVNAIAILPLKNSTDTVAGILTVFHRTPHKRIRQDDFTCLEELSHLASLALDNARLYNTARLEIASRAEIELQIRQAYEKLDDTYDTTLEGWARALDLRDCETEGHSRRVASVAVEMAKIMKVPAERYIHIWRGALLHDIGKLGVPDSILLKPGPLSAEEWQIMRLHPIYAYDWLHKIEYLRPALAIPRSHHERWDGEGYPDRLMGDNIPLEARIFAPIDVWDALSSNRPYRRSWPATKIREHIAALSGTHFDPRVVEVFLSLPSEAFEIHAKTPGRIPF